MQKADKLTTSIFQFTIQQKQNKTKNKEKQSLTIGHMVLQHQDPHRLSVNTKNDHHSLSQTSLHIVLLRYADILGTKNNNQRLAGPQMSCWHIRGLKTWVAGFHMSFWHTWDKNNNNKANSGWPSDVVLTYIRDKNPKEWPAFKCHVMLTY